ncbi:hypothetical protein [Nocardioides sp.]|uniref:hypothetical protein n=1 Tax=Nocardioides sp. TaxID=35761 RepID=UPI002ED7D8A5
MTLSITSVTSVLTRSDASPDPADAGPAHAAEPTTRLARPHWGGLVLALLALVAAQALVGLDVDVPVVRPVVALVTFVGLPALVLHRRARLTADTEATRALYALGLSVLALILGGLLLDTVLPAVGVDRPLAPAPLAIAWLVLDAVLLVWRRSVPLLPDRALRRAVRAAVDARLELAQALAVLALVAAVLGAIRLNNDAGGQVALVAVLLAGVALLAVLTRGGPLGRDVRTLVLVAAALLLATSLRGWSITGHDIQAEFLAFRLTNDGQNWQMSDLPSAYNACLSVNILPTVLVQTTGISGRIVFTVLLQLVFATVPALTYLLGRRFVRREIALTGAVLAMAFPTFGTDMPYLVRQEIAFFFLALALLAATEPGRTRLGGRLLVVLLGVGVILSHYSTTYVLLMALVFGLVAMRVAGLVRRRRGDRDTEPAAGAPSGPAMLLHPLVVAALVAITLAWAGPITHTGGHASDVVRETIDSLTGQGVSGPGSSDTSYWIFSGDQTSPRERMDMFVDETLDYRDAEIPRADRVVTRPGPAELSPALHGDGADPVANAFRFGSAVLMQGFLLLGVIWLLRRRLRGSEGLSRELTYLSLGAVAALGLIVLVPNLSVDYGVLRAFQQTLLVVAPVLAMGLAVALRPFRARLPRLAAGLAAGVPIAVFLVLAGVLSVAFGGQQQRLALASSGVYYDRFFVSDAEMQAITWLGSVDHADPTNERIIANRNVNVRLLAMSDNRAPIADRLYPTLLSKDAYVFVDSQIVERGTSTIFYTGDLLTYTYPLHDLGRSMDLVYSGPDARIYR